MYCSSALGRLEQLPVFVSKSLLRRWHALGSLQMPWALARHWDWLEGFPGGAVVENIPASVGDAADSGLTSSVGKIPWNGAWQPLQYCCPGNPMDRGACVAIVHRVAKSWMWLSALTQGGLTKHQSHRLWEGS